MKTVTKEKPKIPDTPPLTKYQEYEYLKQHISETSKSHKEYERRIFELAKRLGV